MTVESSVPRSIRFLVVAALFAICGAVSAAMLLSPFPNNFGFLFPIPFATLCGFLFIRSSMAFVAAPLIVGVWLISFAAAFCMGATMQDGVTAAGCIGGFIGALGLMFCIAICRRSLFQFGNFMFAGIIGFLGGIPFVPWLELYKSHLNQGVTRPPLVAFAAWEAAVGIYLYAISTRADETANDGQGQDGEPTVIHLNAPPQ